MTLTAKINIITSSKNWMEQQAIDQVKALAALPGMVNVVGLPDLHPGEVPVGAVFITRDIIYPHIIGSDIGCGMSLFATGIRSHSARIDRWVRELKSSGLFRRNFGGVEPDSIGGGNHFAEIQSVEKIYDPESFRQLGMSERELFLLVHSGSRVHGHAIYEEFARSKKARNGLSVNSRAAANYLDQHDRAVRWAAENRREVAVRLLRTLGRSEDPVLLLDSVHNSISTWNNSGELLFIHRKGAAAAVCDPVVIPGSRGSLTYLALPGNTARSGWSVAHGAGRKWRRGICKDRIRNLYHRSGMKGSPFKGNVICQDINLLYEEAPEAYKNIDVVIKALVDKGLIHVVATFSPLLTCKG